MKKKLLLALASVMAVSTLFTTTIVSAKGKEPIRLFNGKIEIDKALKEYAKKYEEKTGQEVIVESLGGGADVNGELKNSYASGNMPDIFTFAPDSYKTFKDWLLDVDDLKCFKDTDYGFKGDDGKYYGVPYAVEGYGITYNKDILDKAGVDPAKITNIDELEKAFKTIDEKKDELGLDAVCSVAAEQGQMWWSTGNHLMGVYLGQGLKRDDKKYIDMLNEGKIDQKRMEQFADYVSLLYKYADKNILVSGTYDDQLALWAKGKAAFITQGNWIDPSLPTYNADFKCGIMPAAFEKENTDGILADSPSYWGVYKDGKNIEAVKEFLNTLTGTEEGRRFLVEECGMISPYKSTKVEPKTPLAASMVPFIKEGKTYAWDWLYMPEGIGQNATGPIFDLFAKDQIDKKQFVEMMKTAISDFVEQNANKK